MKAILLLLLFQSHSLELLTNEEISECAKKEEVNSIDQCKDLKTDKISQTCCYFYGKYKDTGSDKYITGGAC